MMGARCSVYFFVCFFSIVTTLDFVGMTRAQENDTRAPTVMTPEHMGVIIARVDEAAQELESGWLFTVGDTQIQLIYDENADRMRMMVPITKVDALEEGEMERLLQANYDSALDARYAFARGIVWSTFIHPLSALGDEEFLSGMGQTVNLAKTFGSTYSSGALVFGGGDSQDLMLRSLIDDLLKKGIPI